MDINKLKFTILQLEILRFLFNRVGASFNQKNISDNLEVSPTAVSKSLELLKNENLIKVIKDPQSQTLVIELNLDNPLVFQLKRAENLKMLYESGLPLMLDSAFPGATIILFGSFSFGEDNKNSDIDIAIIGSKQKSINLDKYEKMFSKEIILQFYDDFSNIHKNLKESLLNGIILKGSVKL
jgi:predicted nucleotidyltransferase